jgi:hypothetical protein
VAEWHVKTIGYRNNRGDMMEPADERKLARPVFWGGMFGFGVVLLIVCLTVYFASRSLFSSWFTNRPDPVEAGSAMWGSEIFVPRPPEN